MRQDRTEGGVSVNEHNVDAIFGNLRNAGGIGPSISSALTGQSPQEPSTDVAPSVALLYF